MTKEAAEEVEYEKVREIHLKSSNELCFKQSSICAIYLSEGKIEDKAADMLVNFESKFAPKSDRGIKYNWMWMDVSQEAEFKKTIEEKEKQAAEKEDRDVEPITYPTMVFVKPPNPKKKREEGLLSYVRVSSGTAITAKSVGAMVEKISGGVTYLRADRPKFLPRAKPAKKGKEDL